MESMFWSTDKLYILLFLIVASLLGGCAIPLAPASCVPEDTPYATSCYSSADVTGRIVDEKTGEPIEGAVVVGVWQLESHGFEHYYGAAIHVVESVSDSEGHYRLDGFDGIDISHFGSGKLIDSDPSISVFAEDYVPGGARRDAILEQASGFHRVSPLNGRDIKLKRGGLKKQADEYNAKLWGSSIRMLIDDGNCAVTELAALKVLLVRLEPKYDRLVREGYGHRATPYKDAVKRCTNKKTESENNIL